MKRTSLLLFLLMLCAYVPAVYSASEVIEAGTPITFKNTGGTVVFTINSLNNGAGRISARADLGATHAARAVLSCTFQGVTTVTAGNNFEVYTAYSDGTNVQGEVGTTDAALTTEKRRNLNLVLLVVTDQTATDTNMTGNAIIDTPTRYISLGAWNASGVNTEAGDGTSQCTATPLLRKVQ